MCSQVVVDASKLGLSLKGNHTTDGFWKFTSSAVFAATVVTTIGKMFCYITQTCILNTQLTTGHFPGYGNMSPSSTAGQIFCVFFALFGIPLNVVVLNRVGKYMLVIVKNISTLLEGKIMHRVRRYFMRMLFYACFVTAFLWISVGSSCGW